MLSRDIARYLCGETKEMDVSRLSVVLKARSSD